MRGKEVVRQAFRRGFYTEAAVFPVYVPGREAGTAEEANLDRRREIETDRKSGEPGEKGFGKCREGFPEGCEAAIPVPGGLPGCDGNQKKGLEALFSPGLFLHDLDGDGLADSLDAMIIIPREADRCLVAAACNLAFRFGMETTAYSGCLAGYREDGIPSGKNAVLFEEGDHCGIFYETGEGGASRVRITGRGEELVSFVSDLCGTFPCPSHGRDWEGILGDLQEALEAGNEYGELLFSVLGAEGREEADAYVCPRLAARGRELSGIFPHIRFHNYKDGKTVWEKEWSFPWEKEELERILEEKVYPLLKPGDQVSVEAAISEDKSLRDKIMQEIRSHVEDRGAEAGYCRVLCAYKQGFSWIREAVLPALAGKGADQVEIGFCPFLPEGAEETDEENGALPSYNNIGAGDPEAWYDLAIRPLLELYPVRDEIVKCLGIGKENVVFRRMEKEEAISAAGSHPVAGSHSAAGSGLREPESASPDSDRSRPASYLFRSWDREGREIFRETYCTAYGERPFLDAFPEMGKVHPFTGYVRAWINGACVLDERIPTDLERIWDVFQGEVLPECRAYIEARHSEGVRAQDQPLFSRLLLEVEASEPDERLSSREDLFSSLDALHEDLYFVGSDYFKNYGRRAAGELLDAPGLILPVIRKGTGRPSLRAVLTDRISEGFRLVSREEAPVILPAGTAADEKPSLYLKSITREEGKTVACLGVRAPGLWVETLCRLISDGLIEICRDLAGVDLIRFETLPCETGSEAVSQPAGKLSCKTDSESDGEPAGILPGETDGGDGAVYEAVVPRWEEEEKDLRITDIDLMEDRLIGYEDYLEIVRKLKRVPGISVCRAAISYEGREVYAIELLPREEGYISRTKRLARCPSVILNGRHHANEVSSTNALLILLKKLLTEETYRDLPDRLSLAMIPMENVDGTAIHYELQKEHPYWKLHVARFNAVGKEFYNEYFHRDTIHTEAHAFSRLWEKYLPDLVVDDHGVPTHEWEQQFSGYTSPSYKGFWLPRSLLYGYFWYVSDEKYRGNYLVNRALEEAIADGVGQEEEILRWNREWADEFQTYAHAWMPGLFPAEYYRGMINYWIPFHSDPAHRYPSIRFPWITTVAYTSEVADETAQGEYLNLCARTHVAHDEAAIRMLAERSLCVTEHTCQEDGETMTLKLARLRPVVIK